ncbi:hypothetical protein PR048_004540 [Dryococelus australis]|uniref:Reverse transcriptase domain-containing protein n=1 Tax=Dryococelus australis TaxID=614101 RepID=A0ABQ9I5Q8_9NEOP|nr:hypothetical protein PR048_004540 [Dryococelus australis]
MLYSSVLSLLLLYSYLARKCFPLPQGEKIDDFVTDLRKLTATCEFGNIRDSLIIDRIVGGVCDMDKVVAICKLAELTEQQLKLMVAEEDGATAVVRHVKQHDNLTIKQHWPDEDNVSASVQHVTRHERYNSTREQHNYRGRTATSRSVRSFIRASNMHQRNGIMYNTDNGSRIKGRKSTKFIDYGRCGRMHQFRNCPVWEKICRNCHKPNNFASICRVDNVHCVHEISLSQACRKDSNYKVFDGTVSEGKCQGEWCEKIEVANGQWVVKVNHAPPVLGLPTIKKFNLLQRVEMLLLDGDNLLVEKYKNIFEGLGSIEVRPHVLKLNQDVPPTVVPCQKVPFALEESFKKELQHMVELGVIELVLEPTDWVNPVLIVRKPSGQLRVCLNPQQLIKTVKREYCHIPTFEELTVNMKGATVFSTLDANQGLWQIKLSKETSKLTTFYTTAYGIMKFRRLLYGLSAVPEIFHKTFSELFSGLGRVAVYIDDVVVWGGKTGKSTMHRVSDNNVAFNYSKCKFAVSKVKYVGHVISHNGVEIDSDKVSAIRNLPRSTSVQELSRFLGMITYASKFVHAKAIIKDGPELEHLMCNRLFIIR